MAIFDLYSKRQKRLRGDVPDVYTYDSMPNALRVQIVHIWADTLGNSDQYNDRYSQQGVRDAYKLIVEILCQEYGLFKLREGVHPGLDRDYKTELVKFFLNEIDIEKVIDAIELSFKVINCNTRKFEYLHRHDPSKWADNAISELNTRFKEHGIGYQFVENEIIRVDSELLHAEAVKPALRLLNKNNFQGAQQEFLGAYEHYRHGNNKEALNECLKAFESTMKSICDKRKWTYPPNATAKALIDICFDKGLVPSFWQQQLSSLRSMLESSISTGRNKLSGHGQGTNPVSVPGYLVAYMLHMTASTLVFLTTAEENIE